MSRILTAVSDFVLPYRRWILLVYLLLCLIAFSAYGIDKAKAKNGKWRTPEKTLLTLAFFGAPGALLGMLLFRHKTKHLRFQILVPLFTVLHAAAWGLFLYPQRGALFHKFGLFLKTNRWYVLLGYALLCLIVFAIFGIDKANARKGKWRIPEKRLLTFSFFGAPGALLAISAFRHKTKNTKFRVLVSLFTIIHIAVGIGMFLLLRKI